MTKATKEVVGYVWCDIHGGVHNDTTDPYGIGHPDCDRAEHRRLFMEPDRQ